MSFKNRAEALAIVGGFSAPSKMPCHGYSIPASECKAGSEMAKHEGTICSKCYARKGRYVFANVQNALRRRFNSLSDPRWVEAMSFLINGESHFRWHDSGDIQSIEHLVNIVDVCRRTPDTLHWLPTREYAIVKSYIESGNLVPKNLVLRLSATKLSGKPPIELAKKLNLTVSSVSKEGYNCKAPEQKGKCGDCRMCWDKKVFDVCYKQH